MTDPNTDVDRALARAGARWRAATPAMESPYHRFRGSIGGQGRPGPQILSILRAAGAMALVLVVGAAIVLAFPTRPSDLGSALVSPSSAAINDFAATPSAIPSPLSVPETMPATSPETPPKTGEPTATVAPRPRSSLTEEEQREMAREALDDWAALMAHAPRDAIVVTSEMTTQDHGWSGPNGDNAKSALYAGMIDSEVPLSDDVPPPREVNWPDGSMSSAPLISAVNALDEIKREYNAPCPECTPVHIVAVELVPHAFDTVRGRVRLPAWEFTLREGDVHVYRVAAANTIRVPSDGRGLFYSATWTAATNELTVQFPGSPCSGKGPCDSEYTAQLLDSDLAVVVMVFGDPATTSGPRLSLGQRRTLTVTLDEPLGNRAVLDIYGAPVSVELP